jgi:dATP pyrophosphohydrolase
MIASRYSEIGEVLLPGRLSIEAGASLWLNPIVRYKQPRSIQVVIFADAPLERHYLLLRRVASHGGFWQSVTGSLEADETHKQAAVREVLEETGIGSRVEELIELGVVNTFEIAPQWRERYAPGVTHNEEVCFALKVCECEVRVDPVEHDAFAWETYERAMQMIYWDSNRRALAAARSFLSDPQVRDVKNK